VFFMKILLAIIVTTFLSGCMSDSKQFISTKKNSNTISRVEKVYVSVPKDGIYGHINYGGSGINVSRIVTMAFSKYNGVVESAFRYQSFEDAMQYAKDNKYEYLVFPTILEWEDRATEWSGIPDRVSIKITVFDVSTQKRLDSAIVKGKSGWATFGGDHPQDLLPEPVEQYTDSLFL